MILAALEELLYMIAHLWVNYNLYILIKNKGDRPPEKTSTAVHMKKRRRPCTWKNIDGRLPEKPSAAVHLKNRRLLQKIMFLILRPKQFSSVWVRDTGNAATFSQSAPMIYHHCPNLPDLAGAPALIFNWECVIQYPTNRNPAQSL